MTESPTGRWNMDAIPIQSVTVPKRRECNIKDVILYFDYSKAEFHIARMGCYQAECELIRSLVQEIDHHARRYARAKRIVRRAVRRMPSTSRHFLLRNTNVFTLS